MNKVRKNKIIIAKKAGFCFGVKRAVKMAEKALRKNKNPVYCLGELIHNPTTVTDLKKKGLRIVKDIKRLKKGNTLIIRSHGTTPNVFKLAGKRKIKIIDATCPFVKNAQKIIADFHNKGFQVVIFGDPKHSEVIGLKANAKNKAIIVKNENDLKKLKKFSRIALVSQTTQKTEEFKKIAKELLNHSKNLKVINTICSDSFSKKEEVKKMAPKVDIMIVVGGKNSNNTKKLAEISYSLGTKTYHIESPKEIKKEWFEKVQKIGITAGASTPNDSIRETAKKIKNL